MPSESTARVEIVPVTFREAAAFIREHHRHHGVPRGYKFAIGAEVSGVIAGVALIGRPVARHFDDGWTLEVIRLASNGARNVCSALYAAAWRAARALGYRRLVTYTLATESGASLRGAGWRLIGEAGGGSWSRKDRPRVDQHPTQTKLLWEAVA